ncbi:MAG TPA: hypothetical protein VHN15_00395 [Thermoanaerobaculia bacterium]|nr:hypothetical protein [Thermoanaerobaculia bacterium]
MRLCELSFDPGDFNLQAYGNQLEILNSQLVGARSKLDVLLPATADRMTLLIPYRTAFNEARVAYQKEQAARSRNPVPQVQIAMESLEATPLEDPLLAQDPEAWPDLPQPTPGLEPLPAANVSADAAEMTALAEMTQMPEMPEAVEASAPAEPAPTIQVRTPKAGRLIPTLPDWHKRYRRESASARDAFTRVADRLRSGELPGSADCESLSTSARRAFPALKAPDTHIAGSLNDAYRALVDLGEACERGQQIGAMGLLSLAEAKLGNAEKAMRRQGLEP